MPAITLHVVLLSGLSCSEGMPARWMATCTSASSRAKAIPYCDIVVIDNKAWDVSVNRAHLDREFNTAIFRRLSDLVAFLER